MFGIGLIIGAIGGAVAVSFMIGASRTNHENEIYMEGYLAGQVEALKEGDK